MPSESPLETTQRLEADDADNPPVRYLISCAYALGLDDWHLLFEERWRKPLRGTRRAARPPPRTETTTE